MIQIQDNSSMEKGITLKLQKRKKNKLKNAYKTLMFI